MPRGKTPRDSGGNPVAAKAPLIKTIIGLEKSTAGTARFLGFDIGMEIEKRDEKLIRELQMVFQNPDSTMNPLVFGGATRSADPCSGSKKADKHNVRQKVVRLLDAMRLGESYYDRLPPSAFRRGKTACGHCNGRWHAGPDLILCDEPVSALDVFGTGGHHQPAVGHPERIQHHLAVHFP